MTTPRLNVPNNNSDSTAKRKPIEHGRKHLSHRLSPKLHISNISSSTTRNIREAPSTSQRLLCQLMSPASQVAPTSEAETHWHIFNGTNARHKFIHLTLTAQITFNTTQAAVHFLPRKMQRKQKIKFRHVTLVLGGDSKEEGFRQAGRVERGPRRNQSKTRHTS